MFANTGVAHLRTIYFFSSSPWSACLHVGSCDGDCVPGNGIICMTSGPVLQNLVLRIFCASVGRV